MDMVKYNREAYSLNLLEIYEIKEDMQIQDLFNISLNWLNSEFYKQRL